MAVDALIMPEKVSVGFKGGPTFSTDKVVAVSMQERRFQNQSIARHMYTWSLQNADNTESAAIIDTLRAFWFDRRGDFKAFLMKDWADFSATDEQIAIADTGTVSVQLTKTYSAGINPYVRIIRHIKSGTLVLKVDGVTQVSGVDFNVNSTGLVTFVSGHEPALDSVITASFEFYVPVRFDGDAFSATLPEQSIFIASVDLKAIEVIE
jgi:uncharacterized protein (TIGR02217 family)